MPASRLTLRLAVSACICALASACADSVVGPPTSEIVAPMLGSEQATSVPNISGTWSYLEVAKLVIWDFDDQGKKIFHCVSNGTYTFVQNGSTFTGSFVQTGSCTAEDGTTLDNSFTDTPVTGGTIDGRRLVFHPDPPPCDYVGALDRTLTRMEGTGFCGFPGIATYTVVRWSATRRATGEVSPLSVIHHT